jgi:NitT/TauT family transport system ATP-binding protein
MSTVGIDQPYLTFEGVTKRFGELAVVDPAFDLTIPRGQFVVFLGPSGCGKTTLMRMVGGLETATTGAIRLDGGPVGPPDQRRGMVFQSYSSFPWLTVAQNVAYGMRYRRDLSAAQKRERVQRYLALVGLADFASAFPSRISGGMRQRVAIARTLAAGSEVLLLDEPFGALDALRREQLQVELRRIQGTDAKTIIFVTHDVEEAVFLADRVVVFSARPARIMADVDVAARLGSDRSLALRDGADFFRLKNELLHLVRGTLEPMA